MIKIDKKIFIVLSTGVLLLLTSSYFFKNNLPSEAQNCFTHINSINFENLEYEVIYEEISIFPEINNLKCIGTFIRSDKTINSEFVNTDNLTTNKKDVLDNFDIIDEYLLVYVYTSSLAFSLITCSFVILSLVSLYFKNHVLFLLSCLLSVLSYQRFFVFEFQKVLSIFVIYLLVFSHHNLKYFNLRTRNTSLERLDFVLYFVLLNFFVSSSSFGWMNYVLPLFLFVTDKNRLKDIKLPDLRLTFITYCILIVLPLIEYAQLIDNYILFIFISIYLIFVVLLYVKRKTRLIDINNLNQVILFVALVYFLNLVFPSVDGDLLIILTALAVLISKTPSKKVQSNILNFLSVLMIVFSINISVPEISNSLKFSGLLSSNSGTTEREDLGVNIVHVLLDGLPNSVARTIYDEGESDFIYYENIFSTSYSTEKALLDMFNGEFWNGKEDFNIYRENSIKSNSDLISYLNNIGFQTNLYTDKGGVVHNVNALKFQQSYLNVGNQSDKRTLDNFYGENSLITDSIFENIADLSLTDYLVGYWSDILKINEFNIVNFFSKTPILGFDNLAKAYDDYQKFENQLSYQFVHLIFPHEPYSVTSDCKFTNVYFETPQQSWECSIKLINTIYEKFNGANTLLIVHGDHGPLFNLDNAENLLIKETYDSFILNRLHVGLLISDQKTPSSIYTDADTILIINKIIMNYVQNNSIQVESQNNLSFKIPIENSIFEFNLDYMTNLLEQ